MRQTMSQTFKELYGNMNHLYKCLNRYGSCDGYVPQFSYPAISMEEQMMRDIAARLHGEH
jgi:hypothetical protein